MPNVSTKRERTCIGCGSKSSKGDLHRIVRCPDGSVRYDATGKAAGRGAYVCSSACFKAAINGKLQKALRCAISPEATKSMTEELEVALGGANAR